MTEPVIVEEDQIQDELTVFILGEVGFEVSASDIIKELNSFEGDNIRLVVSSPGGDVYAGIAIMNALRNHSAYVTSYIEGYAASAASYIAIGGSDRVVMRPTAEIMIHSAWTSASGDASKLLKIANDLDRISRTIASVYEEKTGTHADYWLEVMQEDHWLSAQETIECGLADVIEDSRADVEMTARAQLVLASLRTGNKPTNKDENMELKNEIAKVLGISTDDRSDETILAALTEALAEVEEEQVLDLIDQEEIPSAAPEAKNEEAEEEEEVKETETEEVEKTPEVEPEAEEEKPAEEETEEVEETEVEEAEEPTEEDKIETITLDVDTYNELTAAAKAGWDRLEEIKNKDLEDEVNTWISEGRISASRRETIVSQIKKNPEAVRDIYSNIPSGTIPRAAIGTSVEEEKTDVDPGREDVRNSLSDIFGIKPKV